MQRSVALTYRTHYEVQRLLPLRFLHRSTSSPLYCLFDEMIKAYPLARVFEIVDDKRRGLGDEEQKTAGATLLRRHVEELQSGAQLLRTELRV